MRTLRLSAVFATLALVALSTAAVAQREQVPATLITGTLLGADGTPMKLAQVHLLGAGDAGLIARVQVEPDGRFALATVRTGVFRLQFTGVDHYSASVPLLAPSPTTVVVRARLEHYVYADSLDAVKALGDWNRNSFANATPLVRQPDGRYTVTVDATADTVAYELLGLEVSGNRSINGTMSDRWVYDEGGDYKSVIRARDGHATIVLDPAQLDRRPPGDFSASFGDPKGLQARLYALWTDWQTARGHWQDSAVAAGKRHERAHYDWAPFLAGRIAMLPRLRDPLEKQLAYEEILDAASLGGTLDTLVAQRIIRDLPPTSPWWAYMEFGTPSRMLIAYENAHARPAADSQAHRRPDSSAVRLALAYMDRAIADNPDSGVKASALGQGVELAQLVRDQRLANDYYNRLESGYPNSPDLGFLKAMYAPNRVWQTGHDVPAFRFTALDDTTVSYTPASFAGKVVLLDFWATWCGPCLGEMPYLQALHDSLASAGLEMLSISLDNSREDVRKFRGGEWKMPWLQAFAGNFGSDQLRGLEIMMIPRAFLVGRDGKIVAVDVRGEALLPAVREALATHGAQ